ncbi:hypothetical protein RFI_18689 [Reticulomyxa filosa]|uniref:Uncharacterized protein n=1 Tax=Reticulomyxa filosa TaxID=46433 RepID=X6MXM6_RETFI|nr:hypothetical protein RFI_18689 [Reticulomyxa filosa]|eukprot:ETO18579.1 hypothetical protein RFI_18689 [Reticulomyxa filosa]
MELLDNINDLAMKISKAQGINAWRTFSNVKIEDRVRQLLQKIEQIHSQCRTDLSKQVTQFVRTLLKNFTDALSQNAYASRNMPSNWTSSNSDISNSKLLWSGMFLLLLLLLLFIL